MNMNTKSFSLIMNNILQQKEDVLQSWFRQYPKVIIALSGGVDSCLVAYVARKMLGKENAIAVVGVSPSLKQRDLQESRSFCEIHDIKLIEVNPNEINDPNYNSNPINRCFFCKSALYDIMLKVKKADYPEFSILNGNNKSDLGDYRPGMQAATDFSALSPLADCGFEKEDIRELAKKYNLEVWDKPASPCLSSRFPYGESITIDKLKMVEKAEEVLNEHGFSDVRVRYKNKAAFVEVPVEEVNLLNDKFDEIQPKLIEFGFTDCEIDAEGLVSGKLNREIGKI
jgi:pyridinium-3,5-biscarboxylic acid mononucleotide sulfurtransferase